MAASTPHNGRTWGYTGALLGGLVSIGANVAHSYVPPAGDSPAWRPPIGAVIGAVFWPVALFTAIEILARTAWPTGLRWVVVRFVGLVPVAVVAAIVSYNHLSGLLGHYGEDRLTVRIGPLAVDGLMVMSSAAVMATTPRRLSAPAGLAPIVSTPLSTPKVIVPVPAVADTIPDTPAVAEPVVSGWTGRRPTARRRPRTGSRSLRRARTTRPASTSTEQPESAAAAGQNPDNTTERPTAGQGAKKRVDTRPAVRALAGQHPDMKPDRIAEILGVSERTVKRHLSTPLTANGGN